MLLRFYVQHDSLHLFVNDFYNFPHGIPMSIKHVVFCEYIQFNIDVNAGHFIHFSCWSEIFFIGQR